MLDYVLRIRDLVHGTILFTEQEVAVINHPFFQRLRQIRQNDVAFYVYPSMNTSRFEHTLGVCRVAGMMAETLTKSPKWKDYRRELKRKTGIGKEKDFVELCRLYALLHDIGHFPLSHLFEYGVERWRHDYDQTIREWTGFRGFKKLHEAFGALLAERIIRNVSLPKAISSSLLELMTKKDFPPTHPLSVIKSVVDSEIDADRIDSIQRDGIAAGGEYGHYDIRRLCDAVFIEQRGRNWIVAYSEKALTSMEALLLDRYRIHQWVHFHHRVIVTKMLVGFLIMNALESGVITKEHFNPENVKEFSLRDDVWLWNVLRGMDPEYEFTKIVQGAIFYREKNNILNLWKTRPEYHALQKKVADKIDGSLPLKLPITFVYGTYLMLNIEDIPVLVYKVEFTPVKEKGTFLYSEAKNELTGKNLFSESELVANLNTLWKKESQYHILFVGDNIRERTEEIKEQWVDKTAYFVENIHVWHPELT